MSKIYLKQHHIRTAAREAVETLLSSDAWLPSPTMVYGVPRGGIPAAYCLMAQMLKHGRNCEMVDTPQAAHIIVDDVIDSGKTKNRFCDYSAVFVSLFDAKQHDGWLVFPWEVQDDETGAEDIPLRLLQFIGEDPTRGGLVETPARFLRAWQHYASGYDQNPADVLKVFEDGAERYDEMVLVKDIPVYSHCEHHLAPFFGVAHIGYIPNGKIVGLSKLSRLVDVFARRLQVQERLTRQIADAIYANLAPLGVAVVVECRHLCMESRGIQRQGSKTTTSTMIGVMHDQPSTRAEFLSLIN